MVANEGLAVWYTNTSSEKCTKASTNDANVTAKMLHKENSDMKLNRTVDNVIHLLLRGEITNAILITEASSVHTPNILDRSLVAVQVYRAMQ